MPRFYIHFQSGDTVAKDELGHEFPGIGEAMEAAMMSAREILADNIKGNTDKPLRAVMIANESGEILMTIPARSILPETLKN